MAVTVTVALPAAKETQILTHIAQSVAANPELTPRSLAALTKASRAHKLSVLLDKDVPVGWLISESLTTRTEELGMAYIEPNYRKQHHLGALVTPLLDDTKQYVFATYSPAIVAYMENTFGFKKSTLARVVVLSNGKFLAKRLNKKSVRAINGRLSKQPAYYAARSVVKTIEAAS